MCQMKYNLFICLLHFVVTRLSAKYEGRFSSGNWINLSNCLYEQPQSHLQTQAVALLCWIKWAANGILTQRWGISNIPRLKQFHNMSISNNDRIHFPLINLFCQISYKQKLSTSLLLAVGQIFFVLCVNHWCCLLYRHRRTCLYTSTEEWIVNFQWLLKGRLFDQKRGKNIKSL